MSLFICLHFLIKKHICLCRIVLEGHTRCWIPKEEGWERDINLLYTLLHLLNFVICTCITNTKKKKSNAKKSLKYQMRSGIQRIFWFKIAKYAKIFIYSLCIPRPHQKNAKFTTMKRTGGKLLASKIFLNISGKGKSNERF